MPCKRFIDCSFFDYACHRIILVDQSRPVNYEFLEVRVQELEQRTLLEFVHPGDIEPAPAGWRGPSETIGER